MRYVCSLVLLLFVIAGLFAPAAEARGKRSGAKESSLSSVRKPRKLQIKPAIYNGKNSHPQTVKKRRWWQRR